MKTTIILLCSAALALSQAADAVAFKCQVNGRTVYQSSPCTLETPDAGKVKITNVNPATEARAAARRDALDQEVRQNKLDQAAINAKNAQADRDRALAFESLNQADIARRNADIHQQEADAAKRESEARARFWDKESGISPVFGR